MARVCCWRVWSGDNLNRTGPTKTVLIIAWIVTALVASPALASELTPETTAAFDRYIRLTEERMKDDLRDNHFLYIDRLPEERRAKIAAEMQRGEFFIERLHTLENGQPIHIPGGAIHHWIGIAFIPRATFSQTLKVLQDYAKYQEIYKPDIRKSKLLESDGKKSKIYFQLYKKSVVSVVLNANFDADTRLISKTRGETWSDSTRVAEVRNPGEPDEHELPVGQDHGYLWRLNSYWRIEEKDGGVYLQVESAALTRTVPAIFGWIVHNLSRSVVTNLLNSTVKAVNDRGDSASASPGNAILLNGVFQTAWRR